MDLTEEQNTTVLKILGQVTETPVKDLKPETNLVSDLLLDSVLRVELVARIEDSLKVTVLESNISADTSVEKLLELVKNAEPVKPRPQLRKWPRSGLGSVLRYLAQSLFFLPILRLFISVKAEGLENLDKASQPMILMPNHVRYLDALILLAALPSQFRKQMVFAAAQDMMYEKYKRYSALNELFFNMFPFPRRENENIRHGLDLMGQLLDQSWSVIVYPEGHVSRSNEIMDLKRGAGLIGVEMGADIVPVRFHGLADVLPGHVTWPKNRGPVTVKFGEPIRFERSVSYVKATEEIAAAMKKL